MPALAVITNPRARRNRRARSRVDALARIVGARGEVLAPDGFDALQAAMDGLAARGVGVIVVDGGDGTLHRVLTAAGRAWADADLPRFAILRGGTMNIVAQSVGSRGRPERALASVVAGVDALPTTERWALEIEGRLGFIFGNGIVARYLEVHYEGGGSVWNAARLLAAGAVSALFGGPLARRLSRPWTGSVTVDGVDHGTRGWTAVAIGTVEQIGLGFTPFPGVGDRPGMQQVVEVGGGIAALARDLPNIYRGRPIGRPGNRTVLARTVELRGDAPMDYMFDGDFYRGPAALTVAPTRPVTFVLPRA